MIPKNGGAAMINRKNYMSHLLAFKDKEQVKVITGIRRCGKTALLTQFINHLKDSGVPEERIVYVNFESAENRELKKGPSMHDYIKSRLAEGKKTYILLDEVQWVTEWERYINLLRDEKDADIYVAGSGAGLPSAHGAPVFGGCYTSIRMYPLSFREYLIFYPVGKTDDPISQKELTERKFYDEYLRHGGMPPTVGISAEAADASALDIFDAALCRDVIERNNVRDAVLLRGVAEYVAANIGKTISAKRISDHFNAAGTKTTSETIDNYINMMEDAFLFYGVNRYDLKGKAHLKTLGKYYMVDIGIRNALLGRKDTDFNPIIENIAYFELLRRDNRVLIGKHDTLEIDFVADSFPDRRYYQVVATLSDGETLKRKLKSLEAIRDNYEKIILTMDKYVTPSIRGIKVVNIMDFLLYHR
jgi:hypothetical protein